MCGELAQNYETALQKNVTFHYELLSHSILSFLYFERTHTAPTKVIRGTKLEDKFKEDPIFEEFMLLVPGSWLRG